MNIFKTRSIPWWETGLIKWSTFLIGIAVGAYWPNIFGPYVSWLVIIGIVIGIIAAFFWSKE